MVNHSEKISYHTFSFFNYSTKKETFTNKLLPTSFPKSVDPGPAAPASAGRLLEMQILELFPRPTKSGILGVGHSNICVKNPPGDFNASHKLSATLLGKLPIYKHIKLSWHRDLETHGCQNYCQDAASLDWIPNQSGHWLAKSQETMLRTQGDPGRGKEDQRKRTEAGQGGWGDWKPVPLVNFHLPQRAGTKSCVVIPEPKQSNRRCSIKIFRLNINRGDNSVSCSQCAIFKRVHKSCSVHSLVIKSISFFKIAFLLCCPLANAC